MSSIESRPWDRNRPPLRVRDLSSDDEDTMVLPPIAVQRPYPRRNDWRNSVPQPQPGFGAEFAL